MDAYKIMGVAEGSVRSKSDFEKVRQRSKELYKKYASEKREKEAKRILEAFEVIKAHFKKREASAAAAKSSGGGTSTSTSSAAAAKLAKPPSTSSGGDHHQKKLASLRQEFSGQPSERKAAESSSGRTGSSSQLSRSRSDQAVSSQAKVVKSSSNGASGSSSTIRSSGSIIPGSNGSTKRPTTQDIPFGSKRTCVAPTPPVQNGTKDISASARLICKCGANYGAVRFQGADGSFVCPSCRFRAMDPLNIVHKGSKGMLQIKLVQKPLVPEDAKLEASFKFKLDVPQIKEWRKAGENIECRMCRLDTYNAWQSWPNSMIFKVNGKQAFAIEEPKPGHKRRDLPHRISANLKPGMNICEVSLKDKDVQKFALAILRTSPRVPRDMIKSVPFKDKEDCKQRVKELLFSSMLEGCVEDFQAVVSDRSRLICPISMSRIRTPARGKKCKHLQSFDLESYLVSNQKMVAFNKRWLCPVCDRVIKPPDDLFVDTLLLSILEESQEQLAEEVAFDSNAGWTVTAFADPPGSDSEDAFEPPDSKAPVSSSPQDVADDDSSDVAVAEDQPGSPGASDDAAANGTVNNTGNSEKGDSPAADGDEAADKDTADPPQGSPQESTQSGGPAGSPSAVSGSPADWGSGSPAAESDEENGDCQTDPYMVDMKDDDDDDVDEDFVATLNESPKEGDEPGKAAPKNGHTQQLMQMIATPAPLASPMPGSPAPLASPPPASPTEEGNCVSLDD